jgi:hypothetical protein
VSANTFYLCPFCFRLCDTDEHCHEHPMVCCEPGEWGDNRRKPVTDLRGDIQSPAPRWFLEATGQAGAMGRYTRFSLKG